VLRCLLFTSMFISATGHGEDLFFEDDSATELRRHGQGVVRFFKGVSAVTDGVERLIHDAAETVGGFLRRGLSKTDALQAPMSVARQTVPGNKRPVVARRVLGPRGIRRRVITQPVDSQQADQVLLQGPQITPDKDEDTTTSSQDHDTTCAEQEDDGEDYGEADQSVQWLREYLDSIYGPQTKEEEEDNVSALIKAVNVGHLAAVRTLLMPGMGTVIDQQSREGNTALMYAAEKGHLGIVKYLVRHGANGNHANINLATPLIFAAQNGHVEIARFLADRVDLEARGMLGRTAMGVAHHHGNDDIVDILEQAASARILPEKSLPP